MHIFRGVESLRALDIRHEVVTLALPGKRDPEICELCDIGLIEKNVLRLDVPVVYVLQMHEVQSLDAVPGQSANRRQLTPAGELSLGSNPVKQLPILAQLHDQE